MSRSAAREETFKILYQIDIHKGDAKEILENFLLNTKLEDKNKIYVEEVVKGTLKNIEYINELIENNLKGWKLNRVSKINIAILRLSVYEIIKMDDIPVSVSINEAVKLAKQYDCKKSGAFINGVLASINKSVNSNEKD